MEFKRHLSKKLNIWKDIHNMYNKLWAKYPLDKQKHAYAIFCEILGSDKLTGKQWEQALDKAVDIQQYICDHVYSSRKKDYDNPFRQATFRNADEMKAAIGTIDDNSFIIQVRKETEELRKKVKVIKDKVKL